MIQRFGTRCCAKTVSIHLQFLRRSSTLERGRAEAIAADEGIQGLAWCIAAGHSVACLDHLEPNGCTHADRYTDSTRHQSENVEVTFEE
jgi:hypothetical protein